MTITCVRCLQAGEPPAAARVGHMGGVKERILTSVCANCWKEWEAAEVKVVNEYRLNFMDSQHREMLKQACLEFLKLPSE
jgi:Fe-S cluster biosynthesis and repair protein YggX